MSPRFIVLEGIDGSGTTSQARQLATALRKRGHDVFETRQPSQGPIGRLTRDLLATQEDRTPVDANALALLFAADRLAHLSSEIRPALDAGRLVVCDRYVVSALAYQSLECPESWIRQINTRADWPDLTFVLDLDPAQAMARVALRRERTSEPHERYDAPDTQRQLAIAFQRLATDPSLASIISVEASPPIDQVTETLLRHCIAAGC